MEEILKEYEAYLTRRRLAPARQIPFFVGWVRRFLAFERGCNGEPFGRIVELFGGDLEKDRRLQEWQIGQALDAVRMYRYRFADDAGRAGGQIVEETGELKAGELKTEAVVEKVREMLRIKHYSGRTEKSYLGWTRRFLSYWRETGGSGCPTQEDVRAFLSHLALRRRVSASTQNQAFSALLFLCRTVLDIELTDMGNNVRAKTGTRVPVVLSVEETRRVIDCVEEPYKIMVRLLYGAGLRVSELVDLRVKDIDFDNGVVVVRQGKGKKDRTTLLPQSSSEELRVHLDAVRRLWESDLEKGYGEAPLPYALARKYPGAGREWGWQHAFPANKLSVSREDGTVCRFHLSTRPIQRAVKRAVRKAGITKHAAVHTFRHCFATHLLLQGVDIREVQELMGHNSVETTMKYLHVVRELRGRARSPLDEL